MKTACIVGSVLAAGGVAATSAATGAVVLSWQEIGVIGACIGTVIAILQYMKRSRDSWAEQIRLDEQTKYQIERTRERGAEHSQQISHIEAFVARESAETRKLLEGYASKLEGALQRLDQRIEHLEESQRKNEDSREVMTRNVAELRSWVERHKAEEDSAAEKASRLGDRVDGIDGRLRTVEDKVRELEG